MTKVSDIRFQLQFMSFMLMAGRTEEAEKALGKAHALLDQMDQDEKDAEVYRSKVWIGMNPDWVDV
jgi:nitrate reductase beta subunit